MKIFLSFLLILHTFSVFAEVDIPSPPNILSANNIINNNAAQTLAQKINNLIKKEEDNYTQATIVFADKQQILIDYEYRYRNYSGLGEMTQSLLIYNKEKSNWRLSGNLYGYLKSKDHRVDLTGDGIPDLILTSTENMRADTRTEQRIIIYDTKKNTYRESNLSVTAENSLDCNGQENSEQIISVKKQSPLPYVVINKIVTKLNNKNCEAEQVSRKLSKYIWSTKKTEFEPVDTNLIEIFAPKLWNWLTSL